MDNKYLVLYTDQYGNITEVVKNPFDNIEIKENIPLLNIISPANYQIYLDYLKDLNDHNYILGGVLQLINYQEILLNMLKENDRILFLGLIDDNVSVKMLQEIIELNNAQTNTIRRLYKKISKTASEEEFFNEIMVLNNDLINTRRELEKKNIQLKELNKTLEEINDIDFLTNTYNRRRFFKDIMHLREEKKYLLYMMDINNFKLINDELGHHIGDQALIEFVDEMKKCCPREHGTLYRIGGDEFVLLLQDDIDLDIKNIIIDINKVLSAIHKKVSIAYGEISIPRNCKIDQVKADEILKKADEKMYKHKTKSKNS